MRIVRATLYKTGAVICVGEDFQMIEPLCGDFVEVSANVLAMANIYTIYELAETHRGPMRQVDREEWKLNAAT